jgi:hypothetical protein
MDKYIKKERTNFAPKNNTTRAERNLRSIIKKLNHSLLKVKKNPMIPIDSIGKELSKKYATAFPNERLSIAKLKKLKKLLIKECLEQSKQELADEYVENMQHMVEEFYSRPKNYIKKALGTLKPSLNLSKIYNSDDELEDDPDLVKEIINKYFKNILATKSFKLEEFPEWEKIYSANQTINPDIYNTILEEISQETLIKAIIDLPKNKASGESEISYDMIKIMGKGTHEVIRSIFNKILSTNLLPQEWKKTIIVLIPKKIAWSHRLNDTRPIALVDSVRKLFTGIINKRFTKVLKANHILSSLNFAGLPEQSTLEPLTIVDSAMQAANSLNEEFWFASLDIAKAFDSAPLPAIKKSLQRLSIPENIVTLFSNLLEHK